MATDVTPERVMDRARERTAAAERALGEAIGALEMAARADERDLLSGYSGSSAVKRLREARKEVERARLLLDALGG